MSYFSTPHCSSLVTKRSPKKGSPMSTILFPSKGMHRLSHATTSKSHLCIFIMTCQVDKKKKTYQQFNGKKKPLLLQVTFAFQEQLKVQSRNHCFWRAAEGTEICAHINLFLPTPQPPLTTIPVQQNRILAQPK